MSDSYGVQVDVRFAASHRLAADGTAVPLHEHRWRVSVCAASELLDRIAIVVDFRKLRKQTDDLLARLQDKVLEDTPELCDTDASPLAVAQWLLEQLQGQSTGETYRIAKVTVGCDPRIDFTVGETED